MNEITLPSKHKIRNSSPGGLGRVRYLSEAPHNIKSLRVSREGTFFVSLKPKSQNGFRNRDLRLSKQAALTTAPGPPP